MRGFWIIFALLISSCTVVNASGNIKRTHLIADETQVDITVEAERCPIIEFDVVADVEDDEDGTVQVYRGVVTCKTVMK